MIDKSSRPGRGGKRPDAGTGNTGGDPRVPGLQQALRREKHERSLADAVLARSNNALDRLHARPGLVDERIASLGDKIVSSEVDLVNALATSRPERIVEIARAAVAASIVRQHRGAIYDADAWIAFAVAASVGLDGPPLRLSSGGRSKSERIYDDEFERIYAGGEQSPEVAAAITERHRIGDEAARAIAEAETALDALSETPS